MKIYIEREPIEKKQHSKKKTKTAKNIKSLKRGKSLSDLDQGKNDLRAKYLDEVRKSIVDKMYYPKIAKRLKLEGKVKVAFEITWPNKLGSLAIITKSKYDLLNQSALEMIESLDNLPIVPEKLKGERVRVIVPVVYDLL